MDVVGKRGKTLVSSFLASAKKIVAGYSDGTFKPQGKCLRRQMVTFLYKYDKFITGNG